MFWTIAFERARDAPMIACVRQEVYSELSCVSANDGSAARGSGEGKGVFVIGSMSGKSARALFQCYDAVSGRVGAKRCGSPGGSPRATRAPRRRTGAASRAGRRRGPARFGSGRSGAGSMPCRRRRAGIAGRSGTVGVSEPTHRGSHAENVRRRAQHPSSRTSMRTLRAR